MIRFFLHKAVNRSVSTIVLFAFLLLNFFFPVKAMALTSGPSQPEFTQFEPAGSSEMVNLFTGDFSYNIPLLDVEGYPVNIAYSGNPRMDQEASWVGLGWNINPGAINRSLRGLPDDFKGDPIQKLTAMKEYTTVGGMMGMAIEIGGANILSGNMAFAMGSSFNNYKGWGTEIASDLSLAANMGKENGGSSSALTAGLGLSYKASTFDGVEFAPYVGISGTYAKAKKSTTSGGGVGASVGVNYSPSVNSRSGVWNQTWNASVALKFYPPGANKKVTNKKVTNLAQKGASSGIGTNFSMTNLGSSNAFLPQIPLSTKSTAWSLDLKIGGGSCTFAAYGSFRGFYSKTKIDKTTNTYKGYGYLNEEAAIEDDCLLDFSREKDGTTYKESTHLPITSHNFDMYSMSAQGMMGVFRSHRNDIGTVYDMRNSSHSNSNAVGGEIAFGDGVNIGLNYVGTFSKENSGLWKSAMHAVAKFSGEAITAGNYTDKETYYHSFSGEKTMWDKTHKTLLGGEDAVKADLIRESNDTYQTADYYKTGYPITLNTKAFNNSGIPNRKPRDRNVSMLNTQNAQYQAIERKIRDYTINNFSVSNGNVYYNAANEINRVNLLSALSGVNPNISSHTSEITTTDIDGSRYVYGIPVYNYYSKDVTFSIDNPNIDASKVPDVNGYVSYTHGTENNIASPTTGNGKGKEGFLEATIMPSYAHSYLLTSVLSTDYVDLTDDGPTTDDYGNYIKYNYSKAADYGWRMPVAGITDGTPRAIYNEGFYSDIDDNKGSYSYGVKQNWYVHSIETKNFVAFFELSDRHDNLGVGAQMTPTLSPFADESSAANTGQKTKKLDKIILYNKQDIINAGSVGLATPIKTVHFQYDYTLCPDVPNNDQVAEVVSGVDLNLKRGKLTLKKIFFSYGKSPTTKSMMSPYEFAYNDQADHNFVEDGSTNNANPSYNPSCIDRWGNYKPQPASFPTMDNIIFPYVDQLTLSADHDKYSRSWCLNTIKTPSGGLIKVDYEADDYRYIMDKRAGQMFKLLGFATGPSQTHGSSMYTNVSAPINWAVIDIANMPSGYKDGSGNDIPGIPGSFTNTQALDFIKNNYLNGLNGKLFFKVKVELRSGAEEFIPGYADIESFAPYKSPLSVNYDKLYIKLSASPLGDRKNSANVTNPVTKAALQMGRKYLQDIMYSDAVKGNLPSPQQAILQLAGMFEDARAIIGGVNKRFIDRGFCRIMNNNQSFVRLINPNQKKIGGGNRVKKITVSDSWNDMISSEASHSYSQKYDYTIPDSETGNIISSGVVNYEPLLGGDENSHRYPTKQPFSSNLSVNDELSIEHPIGETMVPDATVGYAKVTVTNEYDTPSGKTVNKHGTGKTEYEFYTASEFPYIFNETEIRSQPVKPSKLKKLLKLKSKEKLYASQGYVVKFNDMHGKPKSVLNYAEGQLGAISGVRYDYKRNGNELSNNVSVIDEENVITTEEMGVDVDIINDSRMGKSKMQTFSISSNVAVFSCSYYIPLISLWPGYTKLENEFYSLTTTKAVYKYGILDKITAFDNNSIVETQDLLYDKETGQVIVSKTNNQYEDPIYNTSFPAHWAYPAGMGQAYKNTNFKFIHTSLQPVIDVVSTGSSRGKIINSTVHQLLTPGDEVITGPYKFWVVKDLESTSPNYGEYFLLDKNGTKANLFPSDYTFEVVRSGRKNLQNTPIASMTSLVNPINSGGTALNISASTKVLNTSAVEYDDKWNISIPYVEAHPPYYNLVPNTTPYYGIFQKLFTYNINQTPMTGVLPTTETFVCLYNGACGVYPYGPCGSSSPVQFVPNPSIGITNAELNQLLTANSLPSTSNATPGCPSCPFINAGLRIYWDQTTKLYHVQVMTVSTTYNSISNTFVYGAKNYGCDMTLTRVDAPNTGSDAALPITGSSFNLTYASLMTYNQFFLTLYVGSGNSHNGIYKATVCQNISTGIPTWCSGTGCTAMSGNINPYFENIRGQWHPKRTYNYLEDRTQAGVQAGGLMKGDIRDDGTYVSYLPFWNYNSSNQNWEPVYKLSSQTTDPYGLYNKWVMTSEVNKIDHHGNVLQTQNTLRKPSAALYGYNYTRKLATATNALYTDIVYDGFEDYSYVKDECKEQFKFFSKNASVTNVNAHTGKYSLILNSGDEAVVNGKFNSLNNCNYVDNQNVVAYNSTTFNDYYDLSRDSYVSANSTGLYAYKSCDPTGRFGPLYGLSDPKTYILSFWAKQDNPFGISMDCSNITAEVKINGGSSLAGTPKKSIVINGWQKFDYEFVIPASVSLTDTWTVRLASAWSFATYFDDFRIHPYKSQMITSAYDPHSLRLWAQLDEKNYATFYEYDEEGSLVRVKKETEKGVNTVKEIRNGLFRR